VKDGVLEDPRTCKFDPASLQCKAGEAPACLTSAQVEGLHKVYNGPRNVRTGQPIFPGYMRGGEAGWGWWLAGTDVPPKNALQTSVKPVNGVRSFANGLRQRDLCVFELETS
jgi:Tannase and feruloyl esterase